MKRNSAWRLSRITLDTNNDMAKKVEKRKTHTKFISPRSNLRYIHFTSLPIIGKCFDESPWTTRTLNDLWWHEGPWALLMIIDNPWWPLMTPIDLWYTFTAFDEASQYLTVNNNDCSSYWYNGGKRKGGIPHWIYLHLKLFRLHLCYVVDNN